MDTDASRPRQNRVDPFGEIVHTTARGNLMGNRGGCLHDGSGRLGPARWRSRRWIACLLEFKGRRRQVMAPGRYTELFFLDEATALAAGHRPCAECRRAAFNRFKAAWLLGNADREIDPRTSIEVIDKHLHSERVRQDHRKVTFRVEAATLPSGTMIASEREPSKAQLIWHGNLYRWSFAGYSEPQAVMSVGEVNVLTPVSIVRALAAGYLPTVSL